jgi:hypothetical protein
MTDTGMQSTTLSPPKGHVPKRNHKPYEPITNSIECVVAYIKGKPVPVPGFPARYELFLMGKEFEPRD